MSFSDIKQVLKNNRRLAYAVVTVLVLLICQANQVLPVYRDQLQEYLGINDRVFGLLFSLTVAGGFFSVLPGGALVDYWGPARVIRICLVGVSIAAAIVALAGQSWIILAVGMGLFGLAFRPLSVASNAYLSRLFPRNKRRAFSLNFAGTAVGSILWPSLAEVLLGLSVTVPAVTFVMILHIPFAIVAVLVFLSVFLYAGRKTLAGRRYQKGPWRLKNIAVGPEVIFIIALMTMHGLADTALMIWMPRFLGSKAFADEVIGPGYVMTGFSCAYLLSRVALGFVPEQAYPRALIIFPGILGGLVLIGGLLSGSYLPAAGGYVLGGFLWSLEYPTMLSMVAKKQEDKFGAAASIHQTATAGISFLVILGMGLLIEDLSEAQMYKAMLLPAMMFPLVGLGALCWTIKYGFDQ